MKKVAVLLFVSLTPVTLGAPVNAMTAPVLSQSTNRLDYNLDDTNMYGIEINIAEEIILQDQRRRERNANLPLCPIEPGRWWNLECA